MRAIWSLTKHELRHQKPKTTQTAKRVFCSESCKLPLLCRRFLKIVLNRKQHNESRKCSLQKAAEKQTNQELLLCLLRLPIFVSLLLAFELISTQQINAKSMHAKVHCMSTRKLACFVAELCAPFALHFLFRRNLPVFNTF